MDARPYDVVVVGAGAAGIAATVSAARADCRVLLVEQQFLPGGTFVQAECTGVCGLYSTDADGNPKPANSGFPLEFAESLARRDGGSRPIRIGRVFVLPCRTASFRGTCRELLQNEPGITARWSSHLAAVHKGEEGITSVTIRGASRTETFEVRTVIDCSGSAVVCGLANEKLMPSNDGVLVPAIPFRLTGVDTTDFGSPATMVRILIGLSHDVQRQAIPPGLDKLTIAPALDDGTVVCRLNGWVAAPDDDSRRIEPNRAVLLLTEHLRANVREFSNAAVVSTDHKVVARSSRTPVGQYVLNAQDIITASHFEDDVARCSWPIEQWLPDGRSSMRYLENGESCGIPARALRAQATANLFMAGKCISADSGAIASARVAGCCLATGEAAAALACEVVADTGRNECLRLQ